MTLEPSFESLSYKPFSIDGKLTVNAELQPFTKYLRLTLVSMWNKALHETFDFCFSRV